MREAWEFKRPKARYQGESRQIGERLREARKAAGFSQRKAAAILGENQSCLSKIERGQRRVDLAEGRALIRLYNVDANAILFPERVVALGAGRAADAPEPEPRPRKGRGKVQRPKFRGPSPRPRRPSGRRRPRRPRS